VLPFALLIDFTHSALPAFWFIHRPRNCRCWFLPSQRSAFNFKSAP